jgi:hypothetical protein
MLGRLPRDREFESGSLQQPVCVSGEPRGCARKAPQFGGVLRVAGDVKGRAGGEPGRLRLSSLKGLMQSYLLGFDRLQRRAAAVGPRPGAYLSGVAV